MLAAVPDALTGENLGPADRLRLLLDEIEFADRVGLDVFGVGEHHRAEFLDSAPETILAAAAVRTERIRLTFLQDRSSREAKSYFGVAMVKARTIWVMR